MTSWSWSSQTAWKGYLTVAEKQDKLILRIREVDFYPYENRFYVQSDEHADSYRGCTCSAKVDTGFWFKRITFEEAVVKAAAEVRAQHVGKADRKVEIARLTALINA